MLNDQHFESSNRNKKPGQAGFFMTIPKIVYFLRLFLTA